MLGKKIGVDPGSTTLRLHVRGEGVVLSEPALVATSIGGGRVLGVGMQALRCVGDGVELRAPIAGTGIGDHLAMNAVVQYLVGKAAGRQRIFRPDVMLAVPSPMSGDDRREIIEAAARAGARTTYLIDVPLAAAIGAGLPVTTSAGHLVVDVGGDTTEIAVVALEGIVVTRCLPEGGRSLTAAVRAHLATEHGVELDDPAAESAKCELGLHVGLAEERRLRLTATDASGDPAEVTASSEAVTKAMIDQLRRLGAAIREVLDECPPRLLADIRERTGLVLTGGGAKLRGLDRHLSGAVSLKTVVAAEPDGCTARGTGAALDSLDVVRRNFLYVR